MHQLLNAMEKVAGSGLLKSNASLKKKHRI